MASRKKSGPSPAAVTEEPAAESTACRLHKRQTILEAAARAFAHGDYHKVCTEHIAASAKVGKGTLFRYFPSKEELFIATLVYSVEVAAAEIDRGLAGLAEPLERLETVCEGLVAFYRGNDHLFRLLHHDRRLHDQGHDEVFAQQSRLRGRIADMIAAGQKTGQFRQTNPVIAGRLLFGMLRTAMRSPELREKPPGEIARTILDVFIKGIGCCRGRSAPASAPADGAPPG
jgi:AcrR family transcriptional regulator